MDLDYSTFDFEDGDMEDFGDLDNFGEFEGFNYYDQEQMFDDDMFDDMQRISLKELIDKCIQPTFTQAVSAIFPLLVICLVSRLTQIFFSEDESEGSIPKTMLHLASASFGILAAHMFFEVSCTYLLILAFVSYMQMYVTIRALHGYTGPTTAGLVFIFVVACELLIVGSEEWHRIRGSQMVIAMKLISLGFDIDRGHVSSLPSIWQYFGYIFHPGSIVFGPWISYRDYTNLFNTRRKRLDVYWAIKVILSMGFSIMCLIYSTCFVNWFILDNWGRWPQAYRDAQSFRFSHYFVSYVSEATATLTGLGSFSNKPTFAGTQRGNGNPQPIKQSNLDVRWDITVTRPLHIEFPRSLSEVVSNWNLPMHYWLKNYVFKPSQHLGTFAAVLLTYIASSLLHGLNFQLAAVLLSLGFYSYVEHQLRRKVSRIFDACIGPKQCKDHCDHQYKSMHPAVIAVNLCFWLLTVFHLAYLGLMFDSSEGHEQGYTMGHTLNKWSALGYASHFVALGTYVVYLLI